MSALQIIGAICFAMVFFNLGVMFLAIFIGFRRIPTDDRWQETDDAGTEHGENG